MKNRWSMGCLAALLVLCGGLSGCSGKEKPLEAFDVQYMDYFDTFTTVTIYAEDQKQFDGYTEILQENLEYYHRLFDIYNNYDDMNNIKTINDNAGITPVQVDQEILDLLEFARSEYQVTGGKMNVAMGSVLSIWHDYREMASENPELAQVPPMNELVEADKYTDIGQLQVDETASTVYLPVREMKLDVGAIAKGYATQRITDKLREAGVTSALLNVGGNVETIGKRGDGKDWKVGVQNPDTSSNQNYLNVVKLDDLALVTSGTYQRFYEVDGVRYHHIINPDTLMPWNEYGSVTILCRDGGRADALSTAVFNMKLEDGKKLIESLEGVEAIWVLPDGTEVQSSGVKAFLVE
ncbi:MAG: FAD:protein FMN transferase [Lachnospiraceae bacterium]|nr:FAD:protein FMN transferase [Lachnospiraceae bacterium]